MYFSWGIRYGWRLPVKTRFNLVRFLLETGYLKDEDIRVWLSFPSPQPVDPVDPSEKQEAPTRRTTPNTAPTTPKPAGSSRVEELLMRRFIHRSLLELHAQGMEQLRHQLQRLGDGGGPRLQHGT